MKTKTLAPARELEIWLRILYPDGVLTSETAHSLLSLSIPQSDRKRMHELSARVRAGTLTPDEEDEMDAFARAGALLSILKSKARQVVKESHAVS